MNKVGLIGCGGMGSFHAACYKYLENAELVAIAEYDEEKLQKTASLTGAKPYKDAIEMMQKENLDVVDICLPTFLHCKFLLEAMKYVKKVIVEKPICLTEEEAEQLVSAEKETGCDICVGHVVRYMNPYIYLKKLVDEEVYGKLIKADFFRLSPRPEWMRDYENISKTGGMPIDLHIHDVDFIRFLMDGDPKDMKSNIIKDAEDKVKYIWTTYFYDNAAITSEASWSYPLSMQFNKGYSALFEKAAVEVDKNDLITVYPDDGEAFEIKPEDNIMVNSSINFDGAACFVKELSSFYNYFNGDKQSPVVTLDEAIAALRLAKRELAEAEAVIIGGNK